ncbi:PLP-dependent transferase [Dendrothele bispora CBS 962.96]|uniref:PLP-dependent transferase n=1 Tax=Dendrothele bispora (strain CBS 962.96) TaxID=1314807 RepID=A0A4V4HE69_DENBC|nr:PLP-dependent transferase [Dendrothele bispora CBS 962.96]
MGPGNRLGYFVSNPLFAERLLRATEVTTQAPGGWSQSIIEEHLTSWKHEGLLRWFHGLRNIYKTRRDWLHSLSGLPQMESQMMDYITLPKGYGSDRDAEKKYMFSFSAPKGGMFLWIKLNLKSNPNYHAVKLSGEANPEGVLETKIWMEMIQEKILLAPGSYYIPIVGPNERNKREGGAAFFRLSFSFETQDDMETGVKRMASVFERSWSTEDPSTSN